jgi:tetratricopeptide (TPR) repeat protein
MNSCETCREKVEKLHKLDGRRVCRKCLAISMLTFKNSLNSDFILAFPSPGKINDIHWIYFFTSNKIIAMYYYLHDGFKEKGIAMNYGYSGPIAVLKEKKVTKEYGLKSASEVLFSHPKNFAIFYEDIRKIEVNQDSSIGDSFKVVFKIITGNKKIEINWIYPYYEGLESILIKYLKDLVEWKQFSSIKPGSDLLRKLPDPAPIEIPEFVNPEMVDSYREIKKSIERYDNLENIIGKITDLLEQPKVEGLLRMDMLYRRGNTYSDLKKYDEAQKDMKQCLEIGEQFDQKDQIVKLILINSQNALNNLEKGKSGCFIASAAFGNEEHIKIQ